MPGPSIVEKVKITNISESQSRKDILTYILKYSTTKNLDESLKQINRPALLSHIHTSVSASSVSDPAHSFS